MCVHLRHHIDTGIYHSFLVRRNPSNLQRLSDSRVNENIHEIKDSAMHAYSDVMMGVGELLSTVPEEMEVTATPPYQGSSQLDQRSG
jgi:hypothetical protein